MNKLVRGPGRVKGNKGEVPRDELLWEAVSPWPAGAEAGRRRPSRGGRQPAEKGCPSGAEDASPARPPPGRGAGAIQAHPPSPRPLPQLTPTGGTQMEAGDQRSPDGTSHGRRLP